MKVRLNPMPQSQFEAVHQAADVMTWLGFDNYVNHGSICTIDVMDARGLQVIVDYANGLVEVVGFMDGVEV